MRELDYTDEIGRTWRVALPDGVPAEDAPLGVPIGPPPVADVLGLPEPWATRLHNELHRRGLYRLRDVQLRPQEVQAALQAACRLDVVAIVNAYAELERRTAPGGA